MAFYFHTEAAKRIGCSKGFHPFRESNTESNIESDISHFIGLVIKDLVSFYTILLCRVLSYRSCFLICLASEFEARGQVETSIPEFAGKGK